MPADEEDIADQRRLFGTNGIRRIVGTDMTASFALNMGRAIGTRFKGEIVIGMDSRTSNDMLSSAVIAGLLSSGSDVLDIGMAPTPAVQYAVAKSNTVAGVVITASHNPPQFNGIKVIDSDGTELHFTKELEIEKIYFSKQYQTADWHSVGVLRRDDGGNSRYAEGIKRMINQEIIRKARLKIVVDCANGAGGLVTPSLFVDLGCEVITLNAQPDGRFPGHLSEPTPENLKSLMKKVVVEGASFGVAHDGDADRTIFVDDKGNYMMGDRSFALLAGYIVSKNPGASVVSTIATSDCVSDMVIKHGGKIVQTRVGSPVVARKMMELGAIFGGEENGGFIYAKHQYCRDGAMTAALMAEQVAEQGALSELLRELPVYHQVKKKVECPDDRKKQILASLIISLKDKTVDLTDGIKIFEEKDWVLVRSSGTEPIIRVFSQSRSEEKAATLAQDYVEKLRTLIG